MAKKGDQGDIGDLKRARMARIEADREASMSEQLARAHNLSKQMGAIKGAASGR